MTAPDVMVGACAVAIVIWALLFAGCGAPPLPPEPPYVETVAMNRDR